MKILIVEDERKTGEYLCMGLREAGYAVELLNNGVDGLHQALEGDHDLIILDVMLPGMDGWQVLRGLRAQGREMPVLFLTAKDHVDDRVKGLELGADDYLVKPFSFSELLARVRTILRRGRSGMEPTTLQVADLELDLLRRRVTRAGKRIDLTAKEFGLLELLMRRAAGWESPFFTVESMRVITDEAADGTFTTEATVKVWVNEERFVHTAEGNGPVNAIDSALRAPLVPRFPQLAKIHLTDYKVRILDGATATGAVTRVLIDATNGERSWTTIGVSPNIIQASWQALEESLVYGLLHA